jgi:uncharacterized protein
MDMVRDCMRDNTAFGVCLITDKRASETRPTRQTAEVGTLARITAWDMKQLGVLQIRTVGAERFRLLSSDLQASGLLIGEIETLGRTTMFQWLTSSGPVLICSRASSRIRARSLRKKRRTGESDEESAVLAQLPFEQPFQLDSSAWVSNRLCEVLPVPLKAKQKADGADRCGHPAPNRPHLSEAACGAEVVRFRRCCRRPAATSGGSAPAAACRTALIRRRSGRYRRPARRPKPLSPDAAASAACNA